MRPPILLGLVVGALVVGGIAFAATRSGEESSAPSGHEPTAAAVAHDELVQVPGATERDRFYGVAPQTGLVLDDYEVMGSGHVGTLRVPFVWQTVQPRRGKCEAKPKIGVCTWAPLDQIVGYAALNGIQVLPTLAGRPAFVDSKPTPGKDDDRQELAVTRAHPPSGGRWFESWRDFVRGIAARYGPGGFYWDEFRDSFKGAKPIPIGTYQVWNEMNAAAYWSPKPNPKAYADLLEGTSTAIREADPDAKIVLGGMFGTATVPAARYLRDLYAVDGIEDHFDAIAIHPYSPDVQGIKKQLDWVRGAAEDGGDPDVGFWVSEVGWGSGSKGHPLELGDQGQAQMLRRSFRLLRRQRDAWNIEGVVWFTWADSPSRNVCRFCRHAGLFDAEGEAKRSWEVFQQFTGAPAG